MEKITNVSELTEAIQELKTEQALHEQRVKDQFFLVIDSLKPINLLKSTMKDAAASPLLIDKILGASVGAATGYISNKIIIGGSKNVVRNVLGSFLQFGIASLISRHPDTIKKVGNFIIDKFSFRTGKKTDMP